MQNPNETEPDTRKYSERQPNANQVDFGPEWNDHMNREFEPGKQVEI